ncbi:MAG: 2TM domain-containing protein [Arenicella sp.]|nr:2TM domain-containing protein [Arenicella sp.]
MIVRKLRLQRGWSQEQLAEMSGLSVRTIQRIERGKKAGLESLKSLAAVFDIELSNLYEDTQMKLEENMTWEEQRALEYVRDIKGFYSHLLTYCIVMPFIFAINYFVSPGYIWAWWSFFGWGIGIVSHGLSVFEMFKFFDADWEKKQVEKRIGRKL